MWSSFSPRVACRLVDPATGRSLDADRAPRATRPFVAATPVTDDLATSVARHAGVSAAGGRCRLSADEGRQRQLHFDDGGGEHPPHSANSNAL